LEALLGVPDIASGMALTALARPSYTQRARALSHSPPTASPFFLSPAIRTIAATLVAACLIRTSGTLPQR